MVAGVWGKKIGMTQLYDGDKVIPVTAIGVGNWIVTRIKTTEKDGYNALQVGCVKVRYSVKDFKAEWLKAPKKYFLYIREIPQKTSIEAAIGQEFDLANVLATNEFVDVVGVTKGRGFAGVYKRHNFGGAPASHGSRMGRRPGSLSFMCSQGRVIKGKAMAGHMGVQQRMMKNLRVVALDQDNKVAFVSGPVPGHSGSLVFIRKV